MEPVHELLRVWDLCKKHYNVPILDHVSFLITSGECLGAIGYRPSSLSVLAQILEGSSIPDNGFFLVGKNRLTPQQYAAKSTLPYRLSNQSRLVESFTISENIFLFQKQKRLTFSFSKTALNLKTLELFEKFSIKIPPSASISSLSVCQRNIIELMRAYTNQKKLIILDYCVDSYTDQEWENFRSVLKKLQDEQISIFIFSNSIDRIASQCNRVLLFNTASLQNIIYEDEISSDFISHLFLHTKKPISSVKISVPQYRSPSVQIEHLVASGISDLSFSIYPGEIIGLFSPQNHVSSQIIDIISGFMPFTAGSVKLNQQPIPSLGYIQAASAGIIRITELFAEQHTFPALSVRDNAVFLLMKDASRFGFLRNRFLESEAEEFAIDDSLSNCTDIDPFSLLYQQLKVSRRRIICLQNPFVYISTLQLPLFQQSISSFANQGKTILISSTELNHLPSLCHRILMIDSLHTLTEIHCDSSE